MSNKQSAVNKFFPVIDFIDEGVVFNNRSKTDNKFLAVGRRIRIRIRDLESGTQNQDSESGLQEKYFFN